MAHTHKIPQLKDINPELCYIHWNVILTTRKELDIIKDVFIFVEDRCDLKIEVIDTQTRANNVESHKRIGEILIERGDLSSDELTKALNIQKRVGEILIENKIIDQDAVHAALIEQEHVRQIKKRYQEAVSSSSIRVAADKLDNLINLVGELVITQARLTQVASGIDNIELANPVEEIERLTVELRDCALNMRMVPIGTTFGKFRRLVRDLSVELGKEISLVTEGADTELDKTVIERLNDPLVHLIRNSIDHGIRSPQEREHFGKSRTGKIYLTAAHRGAKVLITIRDDGMGIDPEVVRAKAVEIGLISKNAELSQEEIFSLIFTPGFSTASKVTDISGRGVGLDVVKRQIDSLGGTIRSAVKKEQGTCISLFMPLTLAIIEGLLVEVGGTSFILPLSLINECTELTNTHIGNAHGRNVISVRGKLLPFLRLREIFAISGSKPPIEQVVIAEVDNFRVGIVVDEIIGNLQTVIKPLDKVYREARGVSGATIMGDGRVALILDVTGLIRCTEKEEEENIWKVKTEN